MGDSLDGEGVTNIVKGSLKKELERLSWEDALEG